MNKDLADLHKFNQSRDIQGCKLLALRILKDVKKDVACDKDRIEALKGDKTKLRILRKRALNWIFAGRFDKDFRFWCETAGIGPETARERFEIFKKRSQFDKIRKLRRKNEN